MKRTTNGSESHICKLSRPSEELIVARASAGGSAVFGWPAGFIPAVVETVVVHGELDEVVNVASLLKNFIHYFDEINNINLF